MKRILIFIPLIFLSACASKKGIHARMPQSVTPALADGTESIRYSENLKAYPVGRYIEPDNGLMMHEAHTVYRVETTAQWNLHPNAPANIPAGPVVGIVDVARKDSPLTPEVLAEVDRQKAATQAVIEQGAKMNQALEQLSQSVTTAKQVAADNAQMKTELTTAEKRLQLLEEQFRQKQTEAVFTKPDALSPKGTNDW